MRPNGGVELRSGLGAGMKRLQEVSLVRGAPIQSVGTMGRHIRRRSHHQAPRGPWPLLPLTSGTTGPRRRAGMAGHLGKRKPSIHSPSAYLKH